MLLRIAQCNDTFLPARDNVSRLIYEYACALGQSGHESYVVAPMAQTGYRGQYPFELLDFMVTRMPGVAKYNTGIAALDRHYMERIGGITLDIVHAHGPGLSGLEALRLAQVHSAPLIGTFYEKYNDEVLRIVRGEAFTSIGFKYVVDFYDRCDEVWAANDVAADMLRGYGYRGRIEKMPFPVEFIGDEGAALDGIDWENALMQVLARYEALITIEKRYLTRKRGLFRRELAAMDRLLEKRKLTLAWRFLRQDTQNIYAYVSAQPKRELAGGQVSCALPRATPEQQGVESRDLLALYHTVDADEDANPHAMLVMRHGYVIAEGYWTPYVKDIPRQLYSMSKSIAAAAIGMLVDEGRLTLTERLVDLFADKVADPERHPMKNVTVWHLLTMSTGARFDEIGSALGTDWEQEFLDGGVRFEAGSNFFYNSMNTYMLSAIVRRKTDEGLMDYLRPRLFEPLSIINASWETCPHGTEKGGWGLSLALEDAAKIGLLYLNKGVWIVNGQARRLLSEEWVLQATSKQIDTPDGECTDGYGYQIWMAPEEGAYLFNGAFGQYMVVLPPKDALVAVYSGTSRLFAQGDMMMRIQTCFQNASAASLDENPTARHMLAGALESLSQFTRFTLSDLDHTPVSIHWVYDWIGLRAYKMDTNTAGVFPLVLQSVHNVFSQGMERISFHSKNGGMELRVFEDGAQNVFFLKEDGTAVGSVAVRDETYRVCARARAGLSVNGEVLLRLYLCFIETPCTRIITFRFNENSVQVLCDELPNAKDATVMLLELSGVTHWDVYRALMPILKRDMLQNRLREFSMSKATGVLETE